MTTAHRPFHLATESPKLLRLLRANKAASCDLFVSLNRLLLTTDFRVFESAEHHQLYRHLGCLGVGTPLADADAHNITRQALRQVAAVLGFPGCPFSKPADVAVPHLNELLESSDAVLRLRMYALADPVGQNDYTVLTRQNFLLFSL